MLAAMMQVQGSAKLQVFSASDVHDGLHSVAKMLWPLETRASWCESDET